MTQSISMVQYSPTIRVFRDGRIDRQLKGGKWREVKNKAHIKGSYNLVSVDMAEGEKKTLVLRHRLVAYCFCGLQDIRGTQSHAEQKEVCDHRNNNSNDHRAENIRITNQTGNNQNKKCRGYTIDVRKKRTTYRVYIMAFGKKYFLGRFDTPEEARKAYDEGKIKYHPL